MCPFGTGKNAYPTNDFFCQTPTNKKCACENKQKKYVDRCCSDAGHGPVATKRLREAIFEPAGPNKTPLTFFWIYSDTAVAQGVSKQELRWWGEDQDGYVVGYLLAIVPNLSAIPNPDTLTYSYIYDNRFDHQFPIASSKTKFFSRSTYSG